jgi:hypothetical protein
MNTKDEQKDFELAEFLEPPFVPFGPEQLWGEVCTWLRVLN